MTKLALIENKLDLDELGKALSASKVDIPPEYAKRCVLTTLRQQPELMVDPAGIVAGVFEAAQMGLVVDGVLGQAYLVKYGKKVQLVPGYRGFIQLALRGGVKKIHAHVVYEGDDFSVEYGLEPGLSHRPGKERGEIVGAYAVAQLANGETQFEYIDRPYIDKIRNQVLGRSRRPEYSPWTTNEAEMVRKTAIRALFKWLPLDDASHRIAVRDEYVETGTLREEVEVEAEVIDEDGDKRDAALMGFVEGLQPEPDGPVITTAAGEAVWPEDAGPPESPPEPADPEEAREAADAFDRAEEAEPASVDDMFPEPEKADAPWLRSGGWDELQPIDEWWPERVGGRTRIAHKHWDELQDDEVEVVRKSIAQIIQKHQQDPEWWEKRTKGYRMRALQWAKALEIIDAKAQAT